MLDPRLSLHVGDVGVPAPLARSAAMVYTDGRPMHKPRTRRTFHRPDLYHAALTSATFSNAKIDNAMITA